MQAITQPKARPFHIFAFYCQAHPAAAQAEAWGRIFGHGRALAALVSYQALWYACSLLLHGVNRAKSGAQGLLALPKNPVFLTLHEEGTVIHRPMDRPRTLC